MVPPMSRSPATTSSWSAMVEITGSTVSGSNSVLLACSMPARLRAASMTMHCMPRQMPSSGICRSRACRIAPTLPSMPRTPNPPGMSTPSTPSSSRAAPSTVSQSSLLTQRMLTRASQAKPPARSASVTER